MTRKGLGYLKYLSRPVLERHLDILMKIASELAPKKREFLAEYMCVVGPTVEKEILFHQWFFGRKYPRNEEKRLRMIASSALAAKHGISPEEHTEIIKKLIRLFEIE